METAIDNDRKLADKELCVLLIQRGGHPFLGDWALPGGFVQPTETVGEAAVRELREETGVEDVYLEQMGVFSDPKRDSHTRVISCERLALIDGRKVQLQAGDDAQQAVWFRMRYLPLRPQNDGEFLFQIQLQKESLVLSAVERKDLLKSGMGVECLSIIENDGIAFDHAKLLACAIEKCDRNWIRQNWFFILCRSDLL